MAAPEISVVIPTLGRETRLAFALDALAGQTLDRERFEVVVVRVANGNGGRLVESPDDLDVTFLDAPEASASAQRNYGWRAARAPLIAFTDDDCRPAPDWLERILDGAEGPDRFVQGMTQPDPDEAHLLVGSAISQHITRPSVWFETCNLAYPRELLERLGGFDEEFVFGGEDTDLGLRAVAAGAERRYVASALVWHAVHPRPVSRVIPDAPPRATVPLIFVRHPGQRRHLYLGLFWNRAHARLLVGIFGAFLVGRRWAPLAFAPYFVPELRVGLTDGPPTRRAAVRLMANLGERFVTDLAGLLTSARRSHRQRTLVL